MGISGGAAAAAAAASGPFSPDISHDADEPTLARVCGGVSSTRGRTVPDMEPVPEKLDKLDVQVPGALDVQVPGAGAAAGAAAPLP